MNEPLKRHLMTDKEAAEYTGLSLWAINEMRRRGSIPFVALPNIRKFYFEKSALDRWLDGLQQGTTGQSLRLAK